MGHSGRVLVCGILRLAARQADSRTDGDGALVAFDIAWTGQPSPEERNGRRMTIDPIILVILQGIFAVIGAFFTPIVDALQKPYGSFVQNMLGNLLGIVG